MYFEEIRKDFGYSYEKDHEAAKVLEKYLSQESEKYWEEMKKKISGRDVCVVGPAEWKIEDIFHPLIAADDALSKLKLLGIIPDIIVTDLDCNPSLLREISESIVVIHAHGDNIEKIKEFAPTFKKIVGTCQTENVGYVKNIGGFTDGDRSIILACKLGARKVIVIGFNFEEPVRKEGKDMDVKKKKLKWAKKIIDEEKRKCKIFFKF